MNVFDIETRARGDTTAGPEELFHLLSAALLFAARTNQKLQNRTLSHDQQPANSGRDQKTLMEILQNTIMLVTKNFL
jgi:hypothetical protein